MKKQYLYGEPADFVNTLVQDSTIERLDKISRREQCSRSCLVRKGIEIILAEMESEERKELEESVFDRWFWKGMKEMKEMQK